MLVPFQAGSQRCLPFCVGAVKAKASPPSNRNSYVRCMHSFIICITGYITGFAAVACISTSSLRKWSAVKRHMAHLNRLKRINFIILLLNSGKVGIYEIRRTVSKTKMV